MATLLIQPTLTDLDDDQLVLLCLNRGQRNDRPYQELFRRHNKMVWHICYRFLGNGSDAEDMTQEVFFKAYRNLEKFEGRSLFKTWIYRIAVNTCQNELRRRSRRPQESQTELEVATEFIPSAETVDQTYDQLALSELLADALNALRPSEREIIILKDVEERPYADIADIMNISLSAAKMRVQRARLALQREYKLRSDATESHT
ncbi:MAG: RNA polymerase sigma factor [Anaerolineae bacterium]|nr:RNA polymerase sigma factor [Anaerolineae bacterium]MCO5190717.1 RNA polymerase sigma factor [Anaerolineae bacterium]MCO5193519.1 RNA polymerase sigma factor [Anaerolineae bacterium]MCO5196956.1 RNA polymerase sigma factor [Anaerolineae bacterium]